MLSRIIIMSLLIIANYCTAQNISRWDEIAKLQKQGKYLDTLNILDKLTLNDDGKALYVIADYFYNGRKDIVIDKNKGVEFYKKSYKVLIVQAEKGNAEAQYMLAVCLQNGFSNNKEAVIWLEKSYKQGNLKAQCAYAICLMTGKGISRNSETALDVMQKAVVKGSDDAKAYLASYYLEKKQNVQQGIKLAKESADAENPAGQYTLGMAYEKGIGIERDMTKAIALYPKIPTV